MGMNKPVLHRDHALGEALRIIWEDQAAFNLLFRQPPASVEEMMKQIRDFVLLTESELHELLRTTQWKAHRRYHVSPNPGHMRDEAADVFKCVLSMFQILGMTPEDLVQAYWHKTMVVRQRYREEWVSRIEGPCAVIDIDNVIADYVNGFGSWLIKHHSMTVDTLKTLRALMDSKSYLTAKSVGVSDETWQGWKHEFRITGGKRTLPVMPGAKAFLQSVKSAGLQVVLLTSRPIDRYPNIYTDTLLWLQQEHLPFDAIWWSHDKAERVLEGNIREHVQLFVDDDHRFIQQVARLGMPAYWLTHSATALPTGAEDYLRHYPMVHRVRSLDEINIGTLTEA